MKGRVPNDTRSRGALAVTGSKGGVGKTNLVANLAVALARWGRDVLVVDGDLGLSNLDVLLGLVPKKNVEHLVRGEASLEEVLVEGPAGIRILPAASGIPSLASLGEGARERLLAVLRDTVDTVDDLLIDTGAGLGETSLALQLAAARIILVTTPEPTSLVDAYATLKVLWNADPSKPVDVVVNQVVNESEARRAYEQVARAARHFLGREPGWLGAVVRDPKLLDAVRRQRCLIQLHPDSPAGRCYEQIALRLSLSTSGETSAHDWPGLASAREERPH